MLQEETMLDVLTMDADQTVSYQNFVNAQTVNRELLEVVLRDYRKQAVEIQRGLLAFYQGLARAMGRARP